MDTFKSSWQPCQLYIISHICLHCVCVGMCVRLDTNSSALNGLVVDNYLPPTHTWTPTCTQWFPSSGHAVICQPWSLWVAHGGVEAASRSDLWPGFTTGSRRFIPYLPTMPHYVRMMWWAWWTGGVEAGWLDTEAETHLKQRGFSLQPQRKCVCVVFSLRQDNGPQLPPFVCPDDSGLFCAAGNAVKQQSFQIGTVTMSDFDFDLVLNL